MTSTSTSAICNDNDNSNDTHLRDFYLIKYDDNQLLLRLLWYAPLYPYQAMLGFVQERSKKMHNSIVFRRSR